MQLQLIDHDGKTVIGLYDLGTGEGEWDIMNDDESCELLSDLQRKVREANPCYAQDPNEYTERMEG